MSREHPVHPVLAVHKAYLDPFEIGAWAYPLLVTNLVLLAWDFCM